MRGRLVLVQPRRRRFGGGRIALGHRPRLRLCRSASRDPARPVRVADLRRSSRGGDPRGPASPPRGVPGPPPSSTESRPSGPRRRPPAATTTTSVRSIRRSTDGDRPRPSRRSDRGAIPSTRTSTAPISSNCRRTGSPPRASVPRPWSPGSPARRAPSADRRVRRSSPSIPKTRPTPSICSGTARSTRVVPAREAAIFPATNRPTRGWAPTGCGPPSEDAILISGVKAGSTCYGLGQRLRRSLPGFPGLSRLSLHAADPLLRSGRSRSTIAGNGAALRGPALRDLDSHRVLVAGVPQCRRARLRRGRRTGSMSPNGWPVHSVRGSSTSINSMASGLIFDDGFRKRRHRRRGESEAR